MKQLRSFAALLALALAPFSLFAASETPPAPPASIAKPQPEAQAPEKLTIPGVNLTHGPTTVKLGTIAEVKLPEGYAFVGLDSLDKFFELTRNFRNGSELGVIIAPGGWMLFFDYDSIGYVKDDDKDKLDAGKLYKSLEEGMVSGNEHRRSKGWAELKLQGWSTQPHYDEKTNNLTWAFKLSSSADQHKSIGINESIRLLGRGGVMNVTLVADVDGFKETETVAQRLLTQFNYVEGQKYAEYKKGDKLAEYGLAALVVGGAGAIAVKAGLLPLLAKFWKVVVAGVVGIGVGIARIWKKLVGRDQ